MRETVLESIRPTAAELAMDGDYDQLKETLMSLKAQLDECEEEDEDDDQEDNQEDDQEDNQEDADQTETETSERKAMEWILQKYVNNSDEHGRSALFYACNQNSISMVVLLLSAPFSANPNALDADGFPPIYVPCERGFLFVAQMLIKFGANVNLQVQLEEEDYSERDDDGPHSGVPSVATPLLAATLMEQDNVVKLLLESGANPNVVTDTIGGKKSALEIATEIAPNPVLRDLLYDHGAMKVVACRSAKPASASAAAASNSNSDAPPKLTWWNL
jgi:hypothetical protein